MGGCCLFAPGVKSKGNKNSKIKLVVALDGSRRAKHTQQPTEYTRERRGMDRTGGGPTESAGGTVLDRFEGSQVGR